MSRVIRVAKRVTPPIVRARIKGWLGEILAGVAADHQLIARTDAIGQLLEQRMLRLEGECKRLEQGLRSAIRHQSQLSAEGVGRADRVFELLDQRIEALRLDQSRLREEMSAVDPGVDERLEALREEQGRLLEELRAGDPSVSERLESLESRAEELHELARRSLHEARSLQSLRGELTTVAQGLTEAKSVATDAGTIARRAEQAVRKRIDHPEFPYGIADGTPARFRLTELDYVNFEKQFRGGDRELVERLRHFASPIPEHARVLDVGCGTGELLQVLENRGIAAVGVDASAKMTDVARVKGLDAHTADAIEFLRALEPGAFDCIVSTHLIEHLTFNELCELIGECHRVLPEGGLLMFESPNTGSLLGWSRYYTLDPTHRAPRHPALVRFLCERAGFGQVLVDLVNRPASEEWLETDALAGAESGAIEHGPERGNGSGHSATATEARAATDATHAIAENFEKLNRLLFVGQDYVVRSTK